MQHLGEDVLSVGFKVGNEFGKKVLQKQQLLEVENSLSIPANVQALNVFPR